MTVDLFAGIAVRELREAVSWYERLLGAPPAFFPNAIEAVWEIAEERHVYLKEQPEHAGHAQLLVFVDDLDTRIGAIVDRGIELAADKRYDNGVRKVTFRDPDGNEVSFGGAG